MASFRKRSNRWQVRINRDGHRTLVKTFSNRTDAEAWARRTESELERGLWRDSMEAERLTLADALLRYHQDRGNALKGVKADLSRAKVVSGSAIGRMTLARVSSAELSRYRDELAKQGYSPTTVKKFLALVSRVFTMARLDWGMAVANPVQAVRKPQDANARTRRLEGEELARIIAATESPELGAVVRLAVETAMRRSELLGLRWAEIDFQRKVAQLLVTKNGDARTVPLSSKAIEVLRAMPRRIDGKVFGITPDSVTQAFSRACERAGIKDLRYHDLRHEAVSRLFELGLNPMEVAAISGHKTLAMLQRYTHLKAEDLALKLG